MKIFLTDLQGTQHALEAPEGWRLMEVIRDYGFPMKAECGGACACATCHVYVDAAWAATVTPMSAEEEAMLDNAFDLRSNSRLSCQIIIDEKLEGLKVTLAKNPD